MKTNPQLIVPVIRKMTESNYTYRGIRELLAFPHTQEEKGNPTLFPDAFTERALKEEVAYLLRQQEEEEGR